MKIKIILALLISTISYAQITLNELETVIEIDSAGFKTFAMKKGFKLHEIINDELKEDNKITEGYITGNGMSFKKENKKFTLYFNYYGTKGRKKILYENASKSEYLLIKKTLIEKGYFRLDYWNDTGRKEYDRYHESYLNKNKEVPYVIDLEIRTQGNNVVYVISIEKKQY
jgi:hypothetical protein